MKLYFDTDFFLALIKDDDHLKQRAAAVYQKYRNETKVTSSITLLEIWFYFLRHDPAKLSIAFPAASGLVNEVLPVGSEMMSAAIGLSEKYRLNPADSVHAAYGFSADGMVSSDRAFDRV